MAGEVPPNERLQMERIRELDSEQLEVEEVDSSVNTDDDDDDDDLRYEARGDGGAGPRGGFTFDTCLPCTHSYLGEIDDISCRRSFLDGGALLTLPMFYLEGIVLFPDETLPLRVLQPRFRAAVGIAMHQEVAPYTIGVIHVRTQAQERNLLFSEVGTTAEIRQLRDLEDGSMNVLTRGRQRFRVHRSWTNADGAPLAQVQIIEDKPPLQIPREAFGTLAMVPHIQSGKVPRVPPKTLDAHSGSDGETNYASDGTQEDDNFLRLSSYVSQLTNDESSSEDETRNSWWWRRGNNSSERQQSDSRVVVVDERLPLSNGITSQDSSSIDTLEVARKITVHKKVKADERWGGACQAWASDEFKWMFRAQRSAWPHWVYKMYDAYDLARRAADMWRQMVQRPSVDEMVREPVALSYYIASKIPVQDSTRQELLEIDGVVYRLRKEIQLLECMDQIRCKSCKIVIARRSDMLGMSADGPMGSYVNNHGYVFETLTLRKARGLILQGDPETANSWFPGYAWTIADCSVCMSHMGWRFTSVKRGMHPRAFWGIRRSQIAEKAP